MQEAREGVHNTLSKHEISCLHHSLAPCTLRAQRIILQDKLQRVHDKEKAPKDDHENAVLLATCPFVNSLIVAAHEIVCYRETGGADSGSSSRVICVSFGTLYQGTYMTMIRSTMSCRRQRRVFGRESRRPVTGDEVLFSGFVVLIV